MQINGTSTPDARQVQFERYIDAGWRLVPLTGKRPTDDDWNVHENCVSIRSGLGRLVDNVGLAHAYSGTMALDVDDVEQATPWLAERGIDLHALLDAADAVKIHSGNPNHCKLLYQVAKALPSKKVIAGKKNIVDFRCATLDGRSQQDVLPPSIHPETRQSYQWDLGLAADECDPPMIPEALLQIWMDLLEPSSPAEQKERQGLTVEDVRSILFALDPDTNRDEWVKYGMAVKHELGEDGFELYLEWSRQGEKFKSKRDVQSVWRSIRNSTSNPITIDYLKKAGARQPSPDDYEDESGEEPTVEVKRRFPTYQWNEIWLREPPPWIVKGIIPRAGLGVIYGEPGSGKSFLAMDMALSIVQGLEWRGRKVRKGGVIYVAAEGQGGIPARLRAYTAHFGRQPADHPFYLMTGAPSFLENDWRHVVAEIKYRGDISCLFVDTLAQSIAGGDENSSETMGKVIANARRIHEATGVVVILVHHSGKDASKGARGHSSLRGADDFEIEVTRNGEEREMRISKQKDGRDGDKFGFKLVTVSTGIVDEDGDQETSCVVEPAELSVTSGQKVGEIERVILEAVNGLTVVDDVTSLTEEQIVAEAVRIKGKGQPDPKGNLRTNVKAALTRCLNKGFLRGEGGMIYVCNS